MQWQAFTEPADRRALCRFVVLAALCGFGLVLGACSKCDVPNWLATQPGPHACHDATAPQ
ncbi:MAG TPA: hypothetical protein VGH13_16865 [Xanthobacteraceae bacterium]